MARRAVSPVLQQHREGQDMRQRLLHNGNSDAKELQLQAFLSRIQQICSVSWKDKTARDTEHSVTVYHASCCTHVAGLDHDTTEVV